jgi:hypothetical protein
MLRLLGRVIDKLDGRLLSNIFGFYIVVAGQKDK